MSEPVRALFFDVGGVLLTNGWDRRARELAVARFGLDPEDFADRHEAVLEEFETGALDLDGYLDRVVFCRRRDFPREEFARFMLAQSAPHPETLALAAELAADGRWRMATLNNESLPLNLYRIETFGLREIFQLFVSSSFLGWRKPAPRLFQAALQITQEAAAECVFIDDRALNVEAARAVGMRAIHHRDAATTRRELGSLGVAPTSGRGV